MNQTSSRKKTTALQASDVPMYVIEAYELVRGSGAVNMLDPNEVRHWMVKWDCTAAITWLDVSRTKKYFSTHKWAITIRAWDKWHANQVIREKKHEELELNEANALLNERKEAKYRESVAGLFRR